MAQTTACPTDSVTVEYELTLEDYSATMQFLCAPVRRPRSLPWALGVGVAAGVLMTRWPTAVVLPYMLGAAFAAVLILLLTKLFQRRAQVRLQPRAGGFWLCHHELRVDSAGLRSDSPFAQSLLRWNSILEIKDSPSRLFMRLDAAHGICIPKAPFTSAQLETMIGLLEQHARGATWIR